MEIRRSLKGITKSKKTRLVSRYRPCGVRIVFSGREEKCVLRGALRDGGARWGVSRGDGTTPTGELLTKHTTDGDDMHLYLTDTCGRVGRTNWLASIRESSSLLGNETW
jgi:hypothetical protein